MYKIQLHNLCTKVIIKLRWINLTIQFQFLTKHTQSVCKNVAQPVYKSHCRITTTDCNFLFLKGQKPFQKYFIIFNAYNGQQKVRSNVFSIGHQKVKSPLLCCVVLRDILISRSLSIFKLILNTVRQFLVIVILITIFCISSLKPKI